MGRLIELQPHRAERDRTAGERNESCATGAPAGRVLLFTGVRYERMDAEPVRERAGA